MLACFCVRGAVQLFRIPVQDRPGQPFHHRYRELPATGNALQLFPQPLSCRQLADLNPPRGRQLPRRRLQRPGLQPGAGSSPPQWRHPLHAGDRGLTCEQPLHRLIFSDAGEPGPLGQGTGPPARRLTLARVVLTPVMGDLVQPVGLLATRNGDTPSAKPTPHPDHSKLLTS
jgi:hypothetical protein